MDAFFDKIYVIHLDKDIERKRSIEDQFQKHNITNYLFFPAVNKVNIDKEQLKEDKLWAYPNNTFHCQRTCSCGGKGHELSEAQMACHLSHHNVWLDIVQNNYENCLVIEDDLVLINDVNEVFTAMMEHWPKIWDFIYLGHSKQIKHPKRGQWFTHTPRGLGQTHIYAITGHSAKLFSEHTYPLRAAADGYISHFMAPKISHMYGSNINLGNNGSLNQTFKSTISIT